MTDVIYKGELNEDIAHFADLLVDGIIAYDDEKDSDVKILLARTYNLVLRVDEVFVHDTAQNNLYVFEAFLRVVEKLMHLRARGVVSGNLNVAMFEMYRLLDTPVIKQGIKNYDKACKNLTPVAEAEEYVPDQEFVDLGLYNFTKSNSCCNTNLDILLYDMFENNLTWNDE
jgi:hypothetical protein